MTGAATADDASDRTQTAGLKLAVEGSPPPDSVDVEEEDFKTDEEAVEDDELMDSEFEREDHADDDEDDSDRELEDDNSAGQDHAFPLADNDDES